MLGLVHQRGQAAWYANELRAEIKCAKQVWVHQHKPFRAGPWLKEGSRAWVPRAALVLDTPVHPSFFFFFFFCNAGSRTHSLLRRRHYTNVLSRSLTPALRTLQRHPPPETHGSPLSLTPHSPV